MTLNLKIRMNNTKIKGIVPMYLEHMSNFQLSCSLYYYRGTCMRAEMEVRRHQLGIRFLLLLWVLGKQFKLFGLCDTSPLASVHHPAVCTQFQ